MSKNKFVKKKVCMYFTKASSTSDTNPGVFVGGEPIQVVTEFKYHGIILDPTLPFKKQVKRVMQTAKYNLANFRYMRNCLTSTAAFLYMNAMIISNLTYCLTSWTHAKNTTLKPILSLYKQALKVPDRKPNTHHHCHLLRKYKILTWENLTNYTDACLLFKILNGMAPPPPSAFVKQKTSDNRSTRSAQRGDCVVPFRSSSFSQSCFAVRATQFWNTLPAEISYCANYHTFTKNLKTWILKKQTSSLLISSWCILILYCILCCVFYCCIVYCIMYYYAVLSCKYCILL